MEVKKRYIPISLAVPASYTIDTPHLREKTYKIGLLGRACAIFRIDEIVIYYDHKTTAYSEQANLISSILSYMEAPQYLRKKLFPISHLLKYVGILPPLRTPHHPSSKSIKDLKLNELREGFVIKSEKKRTIVDIGVDKNAVLYGVTLPRNKRASIRITNLKKEQPEARLATSKEIKLYWGYRVTDSKLPLGMTIRRRKFDLCIATSKKGTLLCRVAKNIKERWEKSRNILIAFGSPREGLKEILKRENLKLEEVFDFTINTIPLQGTETVRTEEAVFASLAALNNLS